MEDKKQVMSYQRDKESKVLFKKLKQCILEKQEGDRINWRQAAEDIDIPRSTLHQILEEGRNPLWSNMKKIMDYAGCYITCKKIHKKNCLSLAQKIEDFINKPIW